MRSKYTKRKIVEQDVLANKIQDENTIILLQHVKNLDSKVPGSAEKFIKLLQNEYGIKKPNDFLKIPKWLKVSEIVVLSISLINSLIYVIYHSLEFLNGIVYSNGELSCRGAIYGIMAAFATFVFYKMFDAITHQRTTETYNLINNRNKKLVSDIKRLNHNISYFIESTLLDSDVSKLAKANIIVDKANGPCKIMFAWIKEKFALSINWVRRNIWLVIAFLVVIGCVFCVKRYDLISKLV